MTRGSWKRRKAHNWISLWGQTAVAAVLKSTGDSWRRRQTETKRIYVTWLMNTRLFVPWAREAKARVQSDLMFVPLCSGGLCSSEVVDILGISTFLYALWCVEGINLIVNERPGHQKLIKCARCRFLKFVRAKSSFHVTVLSRCVVSRSGFMYTRRLSTSACFKQDVDFLRCS